jgi:ABC-type lipoprotein export system ATPase subunit
MPADRAPAVHLRGVTKDYRGLRPLRVRDLALRPEESVALLGFDEAMAEVLVNLLTGGALPDTGDVMVFGEPTTAITDRSSWLRLLDYFGLVSERGVLLDRLTAEQNLAIPLTLAVESLSAELRAQVRRLGDEIGLTAAELSAPVGELSAPARLRVRLGRALALDPHVVLAEHPNATLPRDAAHAFARDFRRIAATRRISTLVLTADREFARAIADQVLVLEPATGELKRPGGGWLRRFSSC